MKSLFLSFILACHLITTASANALSDYFSNLIPGDGDTELSIDLRENYSADYSLGGGVSLGVVYFDVEQTANSVTRTDVDGIATKLSIGF